jgi:hypothetical protein
MKKLLFILLLLAACAYAALQWKPGLYYGESAVFDNFTLHSSEPLQGDVARLIVMAQERLATSEFYAAGSSFDVYIATAARDYGFFTPFCKDRSVCINPLTGHIFIAPVDLSKDFVLAESINETRRFSAVLAGAAARDLIRRKMRPLSYILLSEWLLRGYSGLIGGTGERMSSEICDKTFAEGTVMRDYEYRLAVEFELSEERITFWGLLEKNPEYALVEKQMVRRYCNK